MVLMNYNLSYIIKIQECILIQLKKLINGGEGNAFPYHRMQTSKYGRNDRVRKLPIHASISRYKFDEEQEFYKASKDLLTYYLLFSKREKLELYSTEFWQVQP